MRFKFDERRAAQAAAVLLRLSGMRQNYTWLLKVLYLADRTSLRETGLPIAGARFANLDNGPLASDVYDCIKNEAPHTLWNTHIQKEGYDVILKADPGEDELSDYAVNVLTKMFDRYKAYSWSRMITLVHALPEWVDPQGSSKGLLPEEILRAAGADDEEISEIETINSHVAGVDAMLS